MWELLGGLLNIRIAIRIPLYYWQHVIPRIRFTIQDYRPSVEMFPRAKNWTQDSQVVQSQAC